MQLAGLSEGHCWLPCPTAEVEVSRERVPLRSAYKLPGQLAQLLVSGGEARALPVVTPPHSLACNKEALFLVSRLPCDHSLWAVQWPMKGGCCKFERRQPRQL